VSATRGSRSSISSSFDQLHRRWLPRMPPSHARASLTSVLLRSVPKSIGGGAWPAEGRVVAIEGPILDSRLQETFRDQLLL
jgi:hypothetical protein